MPLNAKLPKSCREMLKGQLLGVIRELSKEDECRCTSDVQGSNHLAGQVVVDGFVELIRPRLVVHRRLGCEPGHCLLNDWVVWLRLVLDVLLEANHFVNALAIDVLANVAAHADIHHMREELIECDSAFLIDEVFAEGNDLVTGVVLVRVRQLDQKVDEVA
jgi:hypothetical protein